MNATLSPTAKNNGSVSATQFTPVLMTKNYDLFKLMADNRNVNLLHVRRLIDSFNEHHIVCPIIVNEKYEVIDGQHRLHAARETGKPVYYIVMKGYGIKEVQVLNTNQKNWNKNDYLEMYCAAGRKEYLQFKQFMVDFPDFQIQSAERIIALRASGSVKKDVDGKTMNMKYFEEGSLEIPDIRKSYSVARKLLDFKPFYSNFSRGTFVSAMIPLLTKSKVYDHREMIHKLSSCPIKLTDCDKVETYRLLLETIFNYKRQKENKVSFRYE
ncbi:MAG: ParB N-terminal domain-containing protein [Agriterribacter sp.]